MIATTSFKIAVVPGIMGVSAVKLRMEQQSNNTLEKSIEAIRMRSRAIREERGEFDLSKKPDEFDLWEHDIMNDEELQKIWKEQRSIAASKKLSNTLQRTTEILDQVDSKKESGRYDLFDVAVVVIAIFEMREWESETDKQKMFDFVTKRLADNLDAKERKNQAIKQLKWWGNQIVPRHIKIGNWFQNKILCRPMNRMSELYRVRKFIKCILKKIQATKTNDITVTRKDIQEMARTFILELFNNNKTRD